MAPITTAEGDSQIEAATRAYKAGSLEAAKDLAGHILVSNPNSSPALRLLGTIACVQGNLPEAKIWFAKAIQRNSEHIGVKLELADVLSNMKDKHRAEALSREITDAHSAHFSAHLRLGELLQRSGAHKAATACLKKAIAIDPTSGDIHRRLGISLEIRGQLDRALHHYRWALQDKNDDHHTLTNIGNVYRKLGRFHAAEKAYRKALALDPDNAETLNNLAMVYRTIGRLKEAMIACRKSLAIRPDSAHTHHNAGIIHRQMGNHQAALRYYRKAIELDPLLAEAHYNLGELFKVNGNLKSAIAVYQKAIQLSPDMYQAFRGLGDAYRLQGNTNAAIAAYGNAIKVNPACVTSYRYLTVLRKYKTRDPYLVGMESLLTRADLNRNERMLLNFSLGKAYEDLKQYGTAFRHVAEGNRMKRLSFSYDQTASDLLFANIKKAFAASFMQEWSRCGVDDPTPIFILGMPRSGTSLVEQILASHPDVHGAGELATLDQVISTYGRKVFKRPYPQFLSQLTDQDCKEMGSAYVKAIRRHNRYQAFITDKMPQNFLFVGMIAMILPKAKIIHCVRNPMDTCLSIFKNHFSRLHAYAYDLHELGHYYRLYQDLMSFWRQIMPDVMHDVYYEKLVGEPVTQVRRLLSICRLKWHDQCLAFHQSGRPVLTASTSQARRPFYRDSVVLWKQYACHLQPLVDILQKH